MPEVDVGLVVHPHWVLGVGQPRSRFDAPQLDLLGAGGTHEADFGEYGAVMTGAHPVDQARCGEAVLARGELVVRVSRIDDGELGHLARGGRVGQVDLDHLDNPVQGVSAEVPGVRSAGRARTKRVAGVEHEQAVVRGEQRVRVRAAVLIDAGYELRGGWVGGVEQAQAA